MGSSLVFLKLFDRRHAYQFREDWGCRMWTEGVEEQCADFVRKGEEEHFLTRLHDDPESENEKCGNLSDAETEAWVADELLRLFKSEAAVYNALHKHQGRDIPQLFATVTLDITPPSLQRSQSDGSILFHIKGILIQYLDGFVLSNLHKYAPRNRWLDIIRDAMEKTHIMEDNDIMNEDVRPDNVIVQPDGHEAFQVFMIGYEISQIPIVSSRVLLKSSMATYKSVGSSVIFASTNYSPNFPATPNLGHLRKFRHYQA